MNKNPDDYTEKTYGESVDLLRRLATDHGFTASVTDISNYKRIWSRDGVIAGLAGLISGEHDLLRGFERTLRALRDYQDETGRIASNISVPEGKTSFGTTVGRIDATIWYIIGVCEYARLSEDRTFFLEYKQSIDKALFYLQCLELNGRGLLYIPQGGDWADEYINHGYVLFDEMLYYFALQSYGRAAGDPAAVQKSDFLKELIRINYFPTEENQDDEHVYHKALFAGACGVYEPPLPAAYFSSHSIRFHVDSFGIALLLLSNIIPEDSKDEIRSTLFKRCRTDDFPIVPAFHPVIKEGDDNYEHLRTNFLFEFKNKPYQYHNGGCWPLTHGWLIASDHNKERGAEELSRFAEIFARDDYVFPEYYDGQTHEPKGTPELGFSAAAYIIAYQGIKNDKLLFS